MIYIGIDPDVSKSGVATFNSETKELHLSTMEFFELFRYLHDLKPDMVVIDAGWLNKSNWHTKSYHSVAVNSKIAERTGANHEIGRKIGEMADFLMVPYQLHQPTNSKLNSGAFLAILRGRVSNLPSRCNQEERDAAATLFEFIL